MGSKRYWELERPLDARTARNWATWFPQAGRLQLAVLWRDEDGMPQRGKTVTLRVEDWAEHPDAVALLEAFVAAVRQDTAQPARVPARN